MTLHEELTGMDGLLTGLPATLIKGEWQDCSNAKMAAMAASIDQSIDVSVQAVKKLATLTAEVWLLKSSCSLKTLAALW